MRWPGQVKAGSISNEVVSQVDLAATFAAMIDYRLGKDEAIDSYNLLPVLNGEDYERPLRTATVQNTSPNKFALRQGDWVLIDAPSGAAKRESRSYLNHFGLEAYGKGHTGLLFNLKEDPRQSNNLYAKHPDKVVSMRRLLKRYIGGERCAPSR